MAEPHAQPPFAPAMTAAGLVAAITAGLLGGWRIVDCIRFQTTAGQCDERIDQNIGTVIAALGAVAAARGAWETINPNLRPPAAPAVPPAVPRRKSGPPEAAYGKPEPARRRRVSRSTPPKE